MDGTVLVAFGFGWMVVAALLGLYLGAGHESHRQQLAAAAERGDLATYHQILDAFKWRSSVHGHGMLFSLAAVAVGLALARTSLGTVPAGAVIGTLMAVPVVWTFAALRRVRVLMGLADLLFIAVIVLVAIGVAATAWRATTG